MPFCGTCGSQVEGRFCAKCGSPVSAGPAPGPVPGDPPPAYRAAPGPPPLGAAAPMADNVASALCYVLWLISGILFLVIAPYNQNRVVRFHAFQSIFLCVGIIAIEIGLSIVMSILHVGLALFFVWPLIGLGIFILWIAMIVMTFQGKTIELPIIGQLARQQAG